MHHTFSLEFSLSYNVSITLNKSWICKNHPKIMYIHIFSWEGNSNPLQYSCLENPRDRGTWWAAVYGVEQSRTWLKQLSSSSSSIYFINSFVNKSLQSCLWQILIPSNSYLTLAILFLLFPSFSFSSHTNSNIAG